MEEQNKDNKSSKLVPFGPAYIQQSRRLAIPDILLRNVDLQAGDAVELFLDVGDTTGEKAIVVMKSKNLGKIKAKRRKGRKGDGT